jgi:hypothetical protein
MTGEHNSCTCKECISREHPPGTRLIHTTERARSLAVEFFYAWIHKDVNLSWEIADKISEMSKNEVLGCLAHLGNQFSDTYDYVVERFPAFAKIMENTEASYRKHQKEKSVPVGN